MQRHFLKLSYKGTNFFGWQIQPNQITIQEEIEKCLHQLYQSTTIQIIGCGRTDTGVHAKNYFAHFDAIRKFEANELRHKLNTMLHKDIAVQAVFFTDSNTHARFDAIKRTYKYQIHTEKDPFIYETSWLYKMELDVTLMNNACKLLLNHSDFECFSKVKTQVNNFNCTIYSAYWIKEKNQYRFEISANRFLRNMVRAIVGTLILVGQGKLGLEEFQKILDSNDRSQAGKSVPAEGLSLIKIEYNNPILV